MSANDGAKEVDNGEDDDDVQFAYVQYFHYNFTVTRNALCKVERNGSIVVFFLNELFVTVNVDDILNNWQQWNIFCCYNTERSQIHTS